MTFTDSTPVTQQRRQDRINLHRAMLVAGAINCSDYSVLSEVVRRLLRQEPVSDAEVESEWKRVKGNGDE